MCACPGKKKKTHYVEDKLKIIKMLLAICGSEIIFSLYIFHYN
jgi:hypothetical protein